MSTSANFDSMPKSGGWTTSSQYLRSRPATATTAMTRQRPRTALSSLSDGIRTQQITCAVSESRGLSPTVGIALVNSATNEVVLSQINDNQLYSKTVHKLSVFDPTRILMMNTYVDSASKMYAAFQEQLDHIPIIVLDRKYWAETVGLEYIQQFAFKDDLLAIKTALGGNYFATCCFAAAIKYLDSAMNISFAFHSLRIKFEPSEGSMMIDLAAVTSLELIQNIENARSKDCLFGLLNQTLTPMGSRRLRSSILQPLTDATILNARLDALDELTTKPEMFVAVRHALKNFQDVDKLLTALIIINKDLSLRATEQAINNVIHLKHFVNSVTSIHEALSGATSELLDRVRQSCAAEIVAPVKTLIDQVINEDIVYQTNPLDLKNQRTYAVKSGVNGLLDVARKTFQETSQDVLDLIAKLGEEHSLTVNAKYDNARRFYVRIPTVEFEEHAIPEVFVNVYRRKHFIECQTLEILQMNQKIEDSHSEVLLMSDKVINQVICDVREDISALFKISDCLALLDMLGSLAQVATIQDYVRPEFTDTLAIKSGRHAIREKLHKFIPNDVYATEASRFQIITGCNMSGKSTYIRSIALSAIMAQMGSFVPAAYASFPITTQLFARVSVDDSNEANISTFASEMREMAFILGNLSENSIVIIDELGRGTSTRDGLAIALSIAEALVQSKALVWFATHFQEIPRVLQNKMGVVNLHLAVDMPDNPQQPYQEEQNNQVQQQRPPPPPQPQSIKMLYKVTDGYLADDGAYYGLALARIMPLPPSILAVAHHVSHTLRQQALARQQSSASAILVRKRELVLALKERLVQASQGSMRGRVLVSWLRALQEEFVARMAEL